MKLGHTFDSENDLLPTLHICVWNIPCRSADDTKLRNSNTPVPCIYETDLDTLQSCAAPTIPAVQCQSNGGVIDMMSVLDSSAARHLQS